MITEFHTIICSDDPVATREFFRDALGWPSLDAGHGWLIFKTPPSELGVHPTLGHATDRSSELPFHQASLMCDDVQATLAHLRARGVAVDDDVKDQGFGLVPSVQVPGAGWMMLYQPPNQLAHQLDGD